MYLLDYELMFVQGARLRQKSEKRTEGEDIDEDSDEDESDVEEELGYISPLDKVNPYVTFKQALTSVWASYTSLALH